MLFGDWLCCWYENHCKPKLCASTQNNYENVIHNHVLPEIGKISLPELTSLNLQKFYKTLLESGRVDRIEAFCGERRRWCCAMRDTTKGEVSWLKRPPL